MANANFAVVAIHFDNLNGDFTEVTVICGPASDGTLGVSGAHKKAFSKERTVESILQTEIAKGAFLLW